jgi:GNAT superfamily N-acetyltransferase
VVSPESMLCPPEWVGIVGLGGAAIATVPMPSLVEPVRAALTSSDADAQPDLYHLRAELHVDDVLGPAMLAYLDADDFVPAAGGVADRLPAGAATTVTALDALLAAADPAAADESGLAGINSDAFVVRDGSTVVAAAGYRLWPGATAHMLVLTAPAYRGRGLARRVSSAAVAAALADGLLPQWRARPAASRRIAAALGFREYGAQLSVRLAG